MAEHCLFGAAVERNTTPQQCRGLLFSSHSSRPWVRVDWTSRVTSRGISALEEREEQLGRSLVDLSLLFDRAIGLC